MKITMSSLEAKRIADAYLQRNTPYEEVKFVDVRNSDCTYKFLYSVADTFGRVVDIYIEIDFIFNDITAQIVVAKSPLMQFVAILPNANNT
ncbi:hypothetical protein [Culturomica massiliensis]|jgi:hypothetical protein|uniref:hypothetical protein n=1 Tax=Culturomica massiliensis TaxID=1841857 RepID=UPI0026654808|nr:hypothetical protein [Culturomica massiliensis]